jgi:hypothetical protein
MELMARDHPSFNFEALFYMSTTYLIVYVKSCEMSHMKIEKPSEM